MKAYQWRGNAINEENVKAAENWRQIINESAAAKSAAKAAARHEGEIANGENLKRGENGEMAWRRHQRNQYQ
jgi:hypothetical protein